jgi:tripartite-type tricarboxylate transporter receptor subunit TctC
MFSIKSRSAIVLAGLLIALSGMQARAQEYPSREIKIVCGYPAGSGADVLTRYFAEQVRIASGKTVIVENKAGALSAIAAEYVARAKPDGYTLFISGGAAYTANTYLLAKMSYDPVKDFTPIAPLLIQPFVLIVDGKRPFKSVMELTTYLKEKGDRAFYAAPSSLPIANAEMYKNATGVKAVQIPYKTSAQALTEMLDGTVDLYFADPVQAKEQINSGKFRALAVTMPRRARAFPDLPTMAEAGVPGVEVTSWWAMFGPANMPNDVTQKLNGWVTKALATDEVKTFLNNVGAEPFPGSPDFLAQHVKKEIALWADIQKVAKFEPQ